MSARRRSLLLPLLALVTACGSTVQSAAPGGLPATTAQEQGLGGQVAQPVPSAAGGSVGPGTPAPAATTAQRGRSEPVSPSSAGPAPVGAQSSAPSVVRTPLSIGVLTTNNDAAASAGVSNGNTFTTRKAFEALVAAYNARGGVAGRRLIPVYVELQSSSSSYGTDLAAACATFTDDADVEVVLSVVGIYLESFNTCLAKAGVPLVSGDYALGDDRSLRDSPGLLTATTLTTDTRMRLLLERLAAAGAFAANDRLGVVVEGCDYNKRTYDGTVVPVAQRLGHPVSDHVTVRCFGGIGDLSAQASDLSNAVLRFRQNGITQVTFVSGGSEGNLLLLFATAAESQAYRPHYALTSVAIPTVQEANTPPAQLANARGLGWLPSIDTTQGADVLRPEQRRCLADLAAQGLAPTSPADRTFAYTTCDALGLYAAVLARPSGASDLGTSYASPAAYAGRTDFRGGRRTGPAEGRLFGWSTGCSCFAYTGSSFPLS